MTFKRDFARQSMNTLKCTYQMINSSLAISPDDIISISTAQKMIKACKIPLYHQTPIYIYLYTLIVYLPHPASILSIPIYATTQSAARLGPLCAELFPPSATPNFQVDKTVFSMVVPELRDRMNSDSSQRYQVAITGIEAHICVSQTALDLLAEGHSVYVLADGVSSSHRAQVRIALDRLARAGAVVTTSEAWLYEFMGDAKHVKYVTFFFFGGRRALEYQVNKTRRCS